MTPKVGWEMGHPLIPEALGEEGGRGLPGFEVLMRSVCVFQFLPVYHPSPEESRDPTLFANNVQRVMAQ